jgi:hypothetical protein
MRTRQYETPLSNHPPAARTSRSRLQLRIAVGAAVLAMTLAACGSSDNARPGTDPPKTPAGEITRQDGMSSPPDTVRLPDLTDPATRKRFACSFADGYFAPPQETPDISTPDCG